MHDVIDRPAEALPAAGWRRQRGQPSLREVWGSIPVSGTGWRRLLAFLGPGYLVSVGYMDPGNWATSLAGGSKFGYALLSIALLSNLMAILLQALRALKPGSGADADVAAEVISDLSTRNQNIAPTPTSGYSAARTQEKVAA